MSKENRQVEFSPDVLDDINFFKGNRQHRRVTRAKSRSKLLADVDRPRTAVSLDYSSTYKVNDILELDLEEKLVTLSKNESRVMAEKGEEMDEVRKQIEIITKLQEAVNSRQVGQSVNLLSSSRYGREGYEHSENSRLSKTQFRIKTEMDKYSAKNLFNVRRAPGSGLDGSMKRNWMPNTAAHGTEDETLEVLRAVKAANSFNEFNGECRNSTTVSRAATPSAVPFRTTSPSNNRPPTAISHGVNSHSNDASNLPEGIDLSSPPSRPTSKKMKGYLRHTLSSQRGRPVTAFTITPRGIKYDDLLPPRSMSAQRSRSRRELELLSRITPPDEPSVNDEGFIEWKAFFEARRRQKLAELQLQNMRLQSRVHTFVADVERFNKRPKSAKEAVDRPRSSRISSRLSCR